MSLTIEIDNQLEEVLVHLRREETHIRMLESCYKEYDLSVLWDQDTVDIMNMFYGLHKLPHFELQEYIKIREDLEREKLKLLNLIRYSRGIDNSIEKTNKLLNELIEL